ncbi:TrbC/VirB2 family protein [Patescibacteria group bacterium]|nr:TrbC/VirB2 family protein [Patescibacteria group bacterium]
MRNKKIFVLYFLIISILIGIIPIFSADAELCVIDAEIVFVVDTSGSMNNEWITLCNVIDDVVDSLEKKDVILKYTIYGIDMLKVCATGVLPYAGCGAPHGDREQWGPAVEDRAQNYPWTAPIKIIMPISDEGPYCGNGCTDDGVIDTPSNDDNDSIVNAANAADANGVYVFPLEGDGASGCCSNSMNDLVVSTTANDKKFIWGGTPADMADDIYAAVMMAAWDGDGDGFMTMDCPCDPTDLPPGIIGCWDCNDTDALIIWECLYGGLVPCGRLVDDPGTALDESAPCTLCHILVLFKRVVDYVTVNIIFPLAVLMFVISGIMLLTATGDPEKIRGGKKLLKATVIGLVIVLAAWLIVNTIVVFLTPAGSPFQSWHTINCPVP